MYNLEHKMLIAQATKFHTSFFLHLMLTSQLQQVAISLQHMALTLQALPLSKH